MTMAKETARNAKQSLKSPQRNVGKESRRSPGQEQCTSWSASATPPTNSKASLNGRASSKEMTQAAAHQRSKYLRSPWRCSLLTLATSAFSILLVFVVVHSFLKRQQDPKGCAMSYMRPSFTRFSDFDTEHTRFASKYSLYLYREGGVDEDTRVKGVPVLFIPGNAGSYKQMRPIAAEAAHYFNDVLREDHDALRSGKRPLDFFTVDFHEELTAFHGQTLLDQAEYLNEAIAYILTLYHNPQRSRREPDLPDPKSVIVLGHSMGGVVARAMLHTPNYQENTINTIITLSAPHARPPISFDADMVSVYNEVNKFWRESFSQGPTINSRLDDMTLVSVAGGGLDTMIASEYSSLTSLVPDTHGFTVFTSSIPNVWTGMDHLAIMWCDQFRKAIVRAIYDVVDASRPSQTRAQPERIAALRKRLLTGLESVVEKTTPGLEEMTTVTLDHGSTHIMAPGDRLTLHSVGDAGMKANVMPIPADTTTGSGRFTLLTDQVLDSGHAFHTVGVYICRNAPMPAASSMIAFPPFQDTISNISGSSRLTCKNAAADVALLPASTNHSANAFDNAVPFSYLQYNLSDLADYRYVAVIEQSASIETSAGWLIAEFSSNADSAITVSRGHHEILAHGLQQSLPASRPMMTEVKIPEVHATLFAYRFEVHRDQCKNEESFAPLMRQYIQEPYESKYFVNVQDGNINVHGISPYMPPPLNGGGDSEGLSLQIWTDPACESSLTISLRVDVLGSAGKLVMRYRTVFAAFPVLVVAIVLRKQFKIYDATGIFMSFSHSMDQCLRTSLPTIFTALTFLCVALSKATKSPWAQGWLGAATTVSDGSIDYSSNDLLLGTSDPFFWFLVPLFGLVSVGICITINYVVLVISHILAVLYGRIQRRFLPADDSRKTRSSFASSPAPQRTLPIGVLLLLVATVLPYQFAYLVLCLVQIITCVRALQSSLDSPSGQTSNFYNYSHAMLVIMLWILPLNMPVLIVWIHNLAVSWFSPFSTHHNVLCILPYILLTETMSMGNMIPRITNRYALTLPLRIATLKLTMFLYSMRVFTNILMFSLALYAAIYGVTYAYRLHYLVNALCAWLFIIHLSHGPFSLARLSQYLPGLGNAKKRP